jgi:microcystin-dependent protein
MSQPYVGEIRMVGFNFAPVNWAFCNGSLLPIAQNEALFSLLGTTYGGDGVNTFALPNLQGRIPFHQGNNAGNNLILGQISGSETVTLQQNQMAIHTHTLMASSSAGTQPSPTSGLWAQSGLGEFSTEAPTKSMAPSTTLPTGGSQPHDNLPPFLVINFIISLYGIYPSQN